MLSRETRVHLGAVILAVLIAGSSGVFLEPFSGWIAPLVGALAYGVLFGGAHLYFALRGEGGDIGVAARWRFLGFLALMLVLGVASAVAGEWTVGTVAVRTVTYWVIAGAILVYFGIEGVAGYRDSRT